MITSRDVRAKQEEGKLDEAYALGLQLMASHEVDSWGKQAFGWCLLRLIKRDIEAGNHANLPHYRRQLEGLDIPPQAEPLLKQRQYMLAQSSPDRERRERAKMLSKAKQHREAIEIYRELVNGSSHDEALCTSLGWELYYQTKVLTAAEPPKVGEVRRLLFEYLRLDVEKPSLLHTCMLSVAAKLASDNLKMLPFSRLWDLKNLREEDYAPYVPKDGKPLPSLAEKVVRQLAKEAAKSGNRDDIEYALPHVDNAIARYPDDIWLKNSKAKALLALGRQQEALHYGVAVVKAKKREYWAWVLLAEICDKSDPDAALSCYCKALLCSPEEQYIGKVRLALAERLIQSGEYSRAKHEVELVIARRRQESRPVPELAARIAQLPWFETTVALVSNTDFYRVNTDAAEALLYSDLPWMNACVGETFTTPGKDDRPRRWRRLYVQRAGVPIEARLPEAHFDYSHLAVGAAVRVKGELDERAHLQVALLEERRSDSLWDLFPPQIAVIDAVNGEKGLAHYIVSRDIDGVIPLAALPNVVAPGDSLALRISQYDSKQGRRFRVLEAQATVEPASATLRKDFLGVVRADREMGFTEEKIFIPPPLMRAAAIADGDQVAGIAVLNHNRARNSWGWKAVVAEVRRQGPIEQDGSM